MFDIDTLKKLGRQSILVETDGVRENTCDLVAMRFAEMICSHSTITVHAPVEAPIDGKDHHVAVISSEYISDVPDSSNWTIIDPTLKQFNEKYPDIAVIPDTDSRWEEIYSKIDLQKS